MPIKINQKFKELLPPLSPEEFTQLEENIITNGCESPLMIWRNFIIDGHNRFEICEKNNIAFATIDRTFDFDSEDEVLEWIYTNQLGRRNLHPNNRTIYFAQLYALRGKRVGAAKGNQHAAKNQMGNSYPFDFESDQDTQEDSAKILLFESNQNSTNPIADEWFPDDKEDLTYEYDESYKPNRTSEVLAKELGVSEKTIRNAAKVKKVFDTLPAEEKQQFLTGKITQKEVLQKQELTPEQKEMVRKKEAINNENKWNEYLRKIDGLLMDIKKQGGIETVTALWSENGKQRVYQRITELQNGLSEVAEKLKGVNNEG